MLRYFKTKKSFAIDDNCIANLFSGKINLYMTHNTKNTNKPISQICRFGKDSSLLIGLYLLLRCLFIIQKYEWNWNVNIGIVLLIFILSFMNMNAVIYLLPFILLEIILYYKLYYIRS